MALAAWQATIVDELGNVQNAATVEVLLESSGASAALFSDRDGASPLSNPVPTDDDGFIRFYAAGGAYRINAAKGSFTRTWRHVPVGLLGEKDTLSGSQISYERTGAEIAAGVTPVNFGVLPGNVLRYGTNTAPGTTNMSTAINNALASNRSVYAPAGIYKISSPILVNPFNELYGDGWGAFGQDGCTVFYATTDIEIIASSNEDDETLPEVYLHDFTCHSALTDNTTKYQIHLRNMLLTHIARVNTRTSLSDTDYSDTNIGGIWMEEATPGEGSYINHVEHCFIDRGGLLIDDGVTDGTITENFIYGHCCQHSLKFNGAGGNWTVANNNFTSPPGNAAIEINSGNNNLLRIANNFFDGNPSALDSGVGVSIVSAQRVQITGNTFWAMGKNAIRATDPLGLVVQANIFFNCNDEDDGYADVAIIGDNLQPTGNIVSGNWHQQETSRTTKGYAIAEQNDGNDPVQNIYIGNSVSNNYLETGSYGAIQTLQGGAQSAKVTGNLGGGTDTELLGTFTATLTGVTGTVTGDVKYTRNGNLVTLSFPTITGPSNTTSCTLTGLPASLRTSYSSGARGSALVTNSGAGLQGQIAVDNTGTITLYHGINSAGFTNSGTKGVSSGTSITYSLD